MKRYKHILLLLMFSVLLSSFSKEDGSRRIKILLVGDSTTIGNIPRQLNPDGPHLEQMIEILAEAKGLPSLDVVNCGKGGETAKRLLASKWYTEKIAKQEDVDIIFLRMGINDWFRCDDFATDYPREMKALIAQLRNDHPHAEIILSTICRFMPHEECTVVNQSIRAIAKDEGLKLFDLYTPYNDFLTQNGPNTLNIRQVSLDKVPAHLHPYLKPYTVQSWYKGKKDQWLVQANDLSLDPILGDCKGWYSNHHPNTTGYNLMAKYTVDYLSDLFDATVIYSLD